MIVRKVMQIGTGCVRSFRLGNMCSCASSQEEILTDWIMCQVDTLVLWTFQDS